MNARFRAEHDTDNGRDRLTLTVAPKGLVPCEIFKSTCDRVQPETANDIIQMVDHPSLDDDSLCAARRVGITLKIFWRTTRLVPRHSVMTELILRHFGWQVYSWKSKRGSDASGASLVDGDMMAIFVFESGTIIWWTEGGLTESGVHGRSTAGGSVRKTGLVGVR